MSVRRFARHGFAVMTLSLALTMNGCSSNEPAPATPPPSSVTANEVTGTLVAIKDDRPVDGGIELTLETGPGIQERVRVPSMFIAGPRDSIRVLHEVVDAAKIGDRLRARGVRDEDGVLRAQVLELLPR